MWGTALLGFAILLLVVWQPRTGQPLALIDGDGRDYYSYLVSIFIRHDLGHQDITQYYINATPTGTVNVHTIGVALLMLPFFGIGYLWAAVGGYSLAGYSEPFQYMVSIAALFYMLLGLAYTRKLLRVMGFADGVVAITLLLVCFGTNLLNYGLNEPAMSHVYSFALIAMFMYYTQRLFATMQARYLYLSALVFGLVMLVRPVNAIILFVAPFWANSPHDLIQKLKAMFRPGKKILLATLIVLAVLSVQSTCWMIQNGRLLQWTQKDDGFYFSDPHPFLMLFGFNSGFFIYVPLCLLLLLGFIPLWRRSPYRFAVLLLFLSGCVYLFSSHWAYTYFDGLGIRPLVEYYSIFAILGAMLLASLKSISRVAVSTLMVACVALNLVYCYQFKAGILPPSAMTYNKLRYIFLETGDSYVHALGGSMDPPPYSKHRPAPSYTHINHFEKDPKGYYAYGRQEFGVACHVPSLGFSSNKLYVTVSLKRMEAALHSSSGSLVALQVESPAHQSKTFEAFKLNDAPAGSCCHWEQCQYAITLNGQFDKEDSLTVFVWNQGKQPFYIDDFKVEVYNYNREI